MRQQWRYCSLLLSYALLYFPSSLYQYPCTAQIHNTIAICSSKVKCWWIAGLWDVASRARPLTTLLHIIPHKRFLTRMIGSAGSVEIATIGTGYISLAGFTWLVVTIGNASTVWYTWASRMNCCWGAGGWWVRRGSCCWWCGWWTSRALVFTAFLHIIPHKRFLTGMSGSAGSVEIATIGTGYISLAGFTWLIVTIGNASTVWYTWATGMNCCWGAGGWRASRTTCWWKDGGWWDWAGRALLYTVLHHIIPKITVFAGMLTEKTMGAGHKAITKFTWLVATIRHVPTVWDTLSYAHTAFHHIIPHFIGWAGFLTEPTIFTFHIFLIGFTWWVRTVGHVPAIRHTRGRCFNCCRGAGACGVMWGTCCWCWCVWWTCRAFIFTAFLHIIPHKRFLTGMSGSAGSVKIATIGTGYISLAGFTWLVVTIGNASTVWYTWASRMNCCWGAGGWRVRRGSCCRWWGWWTSRALVFTAFLHIIPHKRFLTGMSGSAGSVEIATIGTGYISLTGFTRLIITIRHAATVRDTWIRCSSSTNCCWGGRAWWLRRTSCWWGFWWACRALVFTAFLHIIPHKRFLTGMIVSAGSVEIATIGTGYISLASFTWLVVTIRHAAAVRDTFTNLVGIWGKIWFQRYTWKKRKILRSKVHRKWTWIDIHWTSILYFGRLSEGLW